MLKSIAEVAPELSQVVDELNLRLSKPQQQHVKQIADGLITRGKPTVRVMRRHLACSVLSQRSGYQKRQSLLHIKIESPIRIDVRIK